jgi:hypothetical protein
MAANTAPIFSSLGDVQWSISAMTTANTTKDLTSGTIYLVFTADTTNGGFVQRIRFRSLGTNTNATVARIWINDGDSTTTSSNNTLFDEITLTSITNSETSAQATFELPLNIALPPGYRLYVTVGTAPTSAGWQATVIGGKY